jgi:DNA repair protein RadC
MNYTIKSLSKDSRPREKLSRHGANTLSNEELLAIILGTGSGELNALDLARLVLSRFDNQFSNLARASISDLTTIKGIGPAKAVSIKSMFEIANRKQEEFHDAKRITSSEGAYEQVAFLADLTVEEFWVLYLSRSNEVLKKVKVSQGGVAGTVVDTKVIAKEAVSNLASSIILAHNHPSGNTRASEQDKVITGKLKEGLKMLDVQVIDHIIVARNRYLSFADEGLL